jgi:hypothetical protein
VQWLDFDAPGSNPESGEGLKLISLRISPNATGATGAEFLGAAALSLIDKYEDVLVDWPYQIQISGRDAVEAHYQRTVHVGTQSLEVMGWEAVALVADQVWAIEVLGRSEYRDELQGIHTEFLSSFRVLPPEG